MIARIALAAILLASSVNVRFKPAATNATTHATIINGVYEGEYRSFYASGRPFEIRHYVHGHEEGLQQAWSESGVLYVNYEARNGRHYGMENSTPCVEPSVPYFDSRDSTPRWQPVRHRVADFRMTTQTGKAVSSADLAGHLYIASFIYTKCAAVCPLLVKQLARLQEATRGMPDVTMVSFTVTPETDSPDVLAQFGRDRGIDPARWWLLTGNRQEIYTLARQSFFADDDRASDFLHTEKVLLVDGGGHLRGVYNGTQPFQIDQLAADVARLRKALY